MTTAPQTLQKETEGGGEVTGSFVPVLGQGFQEDSGTVMPSRADASGDQDMDQPPDTEGKSRGRNLGNLGNLGKKKADGVTKSSLPTSHPASVSVGSPVAPFAANQPASPRNVPASPGRIQSSPRVASPASSQIFERNVQEDVNLDTASSAIPSHITTENHIPPVLDASSMAITDDQLTPDTVEIVTHAAHQPAAAVVAGTSGVDLPYVPLGAVAGSSLGEDSQSQPHLGANPLAVPVPLSQSVLGATGMSGSLTSGGDNTTAMSDDSTSNYGGASTYGSLDTTDVRRLSFISFADVVHAEQVAGADQASMRDSLIVSPVPAASGIGSPAIGAARSSSPLRSPASPSPSSFSGAGGASPRFSAVEGSPPAPNRLLTGSPQVGLGVSQAFRSGSPPAGGNELSIETMRQALRKTGSGDLGAATGTFGSSEDGEAERAR